MTDKAKELNTSITLINDKLHFKGTVGEKALKLTPGVLGGKNTPQVSVPLFLK